jgi:hypothetical protein
MAEAAPNSEKQFAKKLQKAGWYTYTDEESGRVVTNAHTHELEKLERLSGLKCEVVSSGPDSTCAKIGPAREQPGACHGDASQAIGMATPTAAG